MINHAGSSGRNALIGGNIVGEVSEDTSDFDFIGFVGVCIKVWDVEIRSETQLLLEEGGICGRWDFTIEDITMFDNAGVGGSVDDIT